jgi:FixJ family two-component response regulator
MDALIAVVDDDPSICRALKRQLESHHLLADVFSSGQLFLASLSTRVPRAVILDVHMPEMTGVEVQQALIRSGTKTSVIFITANQDEKLREAAMAAGSIAFLLKPFTDQALMEAVGRALALHPAP